MTASFYRMPPLPAKAELVSQVLVRPHQTELLVDATGNPVLVLLLRVEPIGEEEARLQQQVLRLIAHASVAETDQMDGPLPYDSRPHPALFRLGQEVWVDLERYEVRRGDQRIPLQAREAELLTIFLRQPRRYIKAAVLAEAIGSEGADTPEHPLEQLISHLRRKVGDPPYHPRLIRCKRHAGYALFPDEPATPTPQENKE